MGFTIYYKKYDKHDNYKGFLISYSEIMKNSKVLGEKYYKVVDWCPKCPKLSQKKFGCPERSEGRQKSKNKVAEKRANSIYL